MHGTAIYRHALLRAFSTLALLILLVEGASAQGVTWGPGLESSLASATPTAELAVVVTFQGEGPISSAELDGVRAAGITRGVVFQSLPMMGVVGTAAAIEALARTPGVRSIWPNAQLQYFNDGSTEITGVDRLRADPSLRNAQGLPFSGRGIAVVVNDSGIDGSLPDLEYGPHVVENVQGLTNLNAIDDLLPVTYTEGMINTDLGSGHGTHVAGIVGGTGESSNGRFEGVAPGADLIGYGSGAVLLILDAVGGFDYALTHQFERGIRVVTNSWGSSGDFDPEDPVNVASYLCYKRGITVTFAAGNEGPGEDTHNPYAVAPWVISVGAGDKLGQLADFSSRGKRGDTGTFANPVDNTTWTYVNEPTIVAPGVDVISARATTGTLPALEADRDVEELGPLAAFYTHMSGTSMATPHVAGIVALVLEANPRLQPSEVRDILRQTATNMPTLEGWQAGAGYVNAYAAVVRALELRTDFGSTLNLTRTFNSNAVVAIAGQEPFSIDFSPVGTTGEMKFNVDADISLVSARAEVCCNTVALVLIDPDGNRYASAISLPELGPIVGVSAPGRGGEWTLTVRGIGSVSGVALDPLGVTNGTAAPETIEGTLQMLRVSGFTGLDDIAGHPAESFIQYAVSNRLVDGLHNGKYRPNAAIERGQLADYLVMGVGIRQYLPPDGSRTFGDVDEDLMPFAEAVAARGSALKDRRQVFDGVMRAEGGQFNPRGSVDRARLAYSMVQSLGLQEAASGFEGPVTVEYQGDRVQVEDAADVPADLRGYVQIALDLQIMHAFFALSQGPFDLQPTVRAYFKPLTKVTRAEYAVVVTRFSDSYLNGFVLPAPGNEESFARVGTFDAPAETANLAAATPSSEVPAEVSLAQNYPNPFNPSTVISFDLPQDGRVRLVVYDIAGREVKTLADSEFGAGHHSVSFEAGDLASGAYVYRLQTPAKVLVRTMLLMR